MPASPIYAQLVGTGSTLPPRIVSNDDLAADLATRGVVTSDEWIVTRTGIRQRHISEPGTRTSTLAIEAARRALADAGVAADEVDLIIVATSTPDYLLPSTACLVQAALNVKNGAAFDVQAACSGFAYALATADSFIRAQRARCALVIGAEVFSNILDWHDRSTCVLFGDGAGAVVLKASTEPGILAARLHADGSLAHILGARGHVAQGQAVGDPFLRMDGQAVFKQAVTVLEKSAREVCQEAGLSVADLDWLIPHQANVRIINMLGKKLGVDPERVVVTVDRHANTSAASVPLALDAARHDGRVGGSGSGQHVLMQGVGGGFTWGSILVRL